MPQNVPNIPEDARQDVAKFQKLQQQKQSLDKQQQSVSLQKKEVENALDALNETDSEEVSEIVGNVIIKKEKDELIDDLEEKKEILELRESKLSEKAEGIDEELSDLQEKLTKLMQEGQESQEE